MSHTPPPTVCPCCGKSVSDPAPVAVGAGPIPQVYTLHEVAEILKCSKSTVRSLLRGREHLARKIGRRIMMAAPDVKKLWELQSSPAGPIRPIRATRRAIPYRPHSSDDAYFRALERLNEAKAKRKGR